MTRVYTTMVIIKIKPIHKGGLNNEINLNLNHHYKVMTGSPKLSMRLCIGLSYVSVMLCTGLIKHINGLLEIQSFLLKFGLIHQNITSQVTVTSRIQKMRPIFKELLHQDTG